MRGRALTARSACRSLEPGDYHLPSTARRARRISASTGTAARCDHRPTISVSAQQHDDGVDLAGFDAALTRAPYTISGTVTDADGLDSLLERGGGVARKPSRSRYDIGVTPGHVERCCSGADEYVYGQAYQEFRPEYYPDAPSPADAQVVTVDENDPDTHHRLGSTARWRSVARSRAGSPTCTPVRVWARPACVRCRWTGTFRRGTRPPRTDVSHSRTGERHLPPVRALQRVRRLLSDLPGLRGHHVAGVRTQFDVALGQTTPALTCRSACAAPVPDGFTARQAPGP